MKSIILCLGLILVSLKTFAQLPTFVRENEESLYKYLTDNNVEFDKADIATLKDINSFSLYNSTERLTVPEAYFFNKNGFKLKGNFDATSCGQTLNNIDKVNKKSFNKNETIGDWMKEFSFFETNEETQNSDYECYIIISWAKFLPKMNEVSFNWYQAIKADKKHKIKVILLNLDVQQNWELSQAHKDALNLE